jgi:indolepyruvate ferredoxin oxidoreductase, beta subunit
VSEQRQRITIAILALGGQGGGVLAEWLLEAARSQGYVAQGTSVPGVAQRTGATVYYAELFPRPESGGAEPVLALMPLPGDVDIVIASELMEAGRAILRGFVTGDRTTLIGSTHRIYSIGEKSALADGRASSERILAAAASRPKRFIGFDMDELASRTESIISAVLFGAVAASGALPFPREAFEGAIRSGGKAVENNIRGFDAGFDAAVGKAELETPGARAAGPTTEAGQRLLDRVVRELPEQAHDFAIEGVRRLCDYQDPAYSSLYLDRLARIRALDTGAESFRLTVETARYLALWMSYEDTIRVADLKVRKSRFERVRDEVRAAPGQPIAITDYMHPRLQEACETMPAWIGRRILQSESLRSWLEPMFRSGRHVRTNRLGWFVLLSLVAGFRRWRRSTLRYQEEQQRIDNWLDLIASAATTDSAAAAELVECQRLIKGYGDTFEQGLAKFNRILSVWGEVRTRRDPAAVVKRLREAAFAGEDSTALDAALAELAPGTPEAACGTS